MVKDRIKRQEKYAAPLEGRSDSNCVLLDFNERTSTPSKEVFDALTKFLNQKKLQVYPEYNDLYSKIADYNSLDSNQICVTNGSNQAIDIFFRINCSEGEKVIINQPSFAMLSHYPKVQGLEIISPSITDDYNYPYDEVKEILANQDISAVSICTPESPTGKELSIEKIELFLKENPKTAFLIDECYYEYTDTTCKELIKKYDNIFISRSFSKAWGLASLRIGYMISSKNNINEMKKAVSPYDVNKLAAVAASAALSNREYMLKYVAQVNLTSKPKLEKFLEEKKIEFIKSSANFILCFFNDSEKVSKKLKQKGILVRLRNGPKIENTLRISIGTEKDTDTLINALQEIL